MRKRSLGTIITIITTIIGMEGSLGIEMVIGVATEGIVVMEIVLTATIRIEDVEVTIIIGIMIGRETRNIMRKDNINLAKSKYIEY